MARSKYIYIIKDIYGITAAFTVKHECKRKIERDLYNGEGWVIIRINDGGSDGSYETYTAKEFLESKP